MSNFVINPTPTGFNILHNDISSVTSFKEDIISKANVQRLSQLANGFTYLMTKGGIAYQLSVDGADGSYQVDQVGIKKPKDNDDLFDTIKLLIV